jgi:hypothetical protein
VEDDRRAGRRRASCNAARGRVIRGHVRGMGCCDLVVTQDVQLQDRNIDMQTKKLTVLFIAIGGLLAGSLSAEDNGPGVVYCPQFKEMKRYSWQNCMEALKDSSVVSSDDRDDVCEDVAFNVAFRRSTDEGMKPCLRR